jgi:uncharacterized DUF497 family protein
MGSLSGVGEDDATAPTTPCARGFLPAWRWGNRAIRAGRSGARTAKIGDPPSAFRPFDAAQGCIYSMHIQFRWSQTKRHANLVKHGLDFADAERVFAGLTFTFEDDRFDYGEQRFVTLGLLAGGPVSLVHTETSHEIRIISFRKATAREARIYFEQVDE